MSKVLMISSNTFVYPYPVYPLGMAVVSFALSEQGHNVFQFDYSVHENPDEELKKTIREFSPDYVGLSIRNIDDVDSLGGELEVLNTERHIIEVVKGETDVPVIAGGSAFSIMPEEIIAYIKADYGVVGSGEEQFNSLIGDLDKGKSCPKITTACLMQSQSGKSGSPLWDKDLVDFYMGKSAMLNLQTKRGCPYNCAYCVYPSLEGRTFRYRDHDAIISDIKRAKDLYGVDSFFFTDSVFNDPEGRYIELAEKIIAADLNIRWAGYFRPKGVGEEEFKILKKSGLYAVEVGSDAGCDETLRRMGKGFTFDDIIDFYNGCNKEGIAGAYFFIFGGPGETEATVREGVENMRKLKDGVIFVYSGIRVLPGTSLHKIALEEGVLSPDDPMLEPVYYFSPGIDVDEMNRVLEEDAKHNRRYIFPPEKGKNMIDAMHTFGYKGLLWNELLAISGRSKRRKRK